MFESMLNLEYNRRYSYCKGLKKSVPGPRYLFMLIATAFLLYSRVFFVAYSSLQYLRAIVISSCVTSCHVFLLIFGEFGACFNK